jgi:hypothetical protein
MPTMREKLMIVNLTKSNEQGKEHKQGENDIEHRGQCIACLIKGWHMIEQQIKGCASNYRHGECPILDEFQNAVFYPYGLFFYLPFYFHLTVPYKLQSYK